jgi:hypothetical protein
VDEGRNANHYDLGDDYDSWAGSVINCASICAYPEGPHTSLFGSSSHDKELLWRWDGQSLEFPSDHVMISDCL